MICPYPDCQGEVSSDDAFCGECGRTLEPEMVQRFIAQQEQLNRVTPPPVPPRPRPEPNRMPLIIGGIAGLLLVVVLGGLGINALLNPVQPTPTPLPPPPTQTRVPPTATNVPPTVSPTPGSELIPDSFNFQLGDLTEANGFTVNNDVRTADGTKRGLLTFKANYQYTTQGSPELMGTVIIAINNTTVLELAASNQALYASTNPGFEVATSGSTYDAVSKEGWLISVVVADVAVEQNPILADGTEGTQPAFTTLGFSVNITTGLEGKAFMPTPEPEAVQLTETFSLADLSADNDFTAVNDLRAPSGRKLGLLSFSSNYNYSTQNAPELIGTVEVRLNNAVLLELAASNQSLYASTNPEFEVAAAGKSYVKETDEGWEATITVDDAQTEAKPILPDGTAANQPVFTVLEIAVTIDTAP